MTIKKYITCILILFATAPVFANKTSLSYSMPQKVMDWKFLTIDDGMVFLLGPASQNKLEISVNLTSEGAMSDPITVNCNASSYYVAPGKSLTCYGNFDDVITMYIAPENFKNGSKGTYEYKPVDL